MQNIDNFNEIYVGGIPDYIDKLRRLSAGSSGGLGWIKGPARLVFPKETKAGTQIDIAICAGKYVIGGTINESYSAARRKGSRS